MTRSEHHCRVIKQANLLLSEFFRGDSFNLKEWSEHHFRAIFPRNVIVR